MTDRPGGETRTFLIWAALLVVLTVGVIILLKPGSPERATDSTRSAEDSTATVEPTVEPKRKKAKKSEDELPPGFGSSFPGLGVQPGISGEGTSSSLEAHRVTIRWSGSKTLGTIAYIIPTSPEDRQGTHFENASSYTLTTTAYGKPDFAVAFVQAGPDGVPVTCEVSVDGRVTDRRSTKGPYGTVWCQG